MINEIDIIKASKESLSACQAAAKLNLTFGTYKKYAIRLGVYKTNQSGKGIYKPCKNKIPLNEILEGKHPQYQTNKIRIRLLEEGIKEAKCEICGIANWQKKKLNFELDHIDGNSKNHKLKNLRIICPNCHSQTDTYCGKNIKRT